MKVYKVLRTAVTISTRHRRLVTLLRYTGLFLLFQLSLKQHWIFNPTTDFPSASKVTWTQAKGTQRRTFLKTRNGIFSWIMN